MSKNEKETAIPKSTELAKKGIYTDKDFAAVFTALIGDTLSGATNPNVTNAACNAAGKLLKMIELRRKYGPPDAGDNDSMALVGAPKTPTNPPLVTRESVLDKLSDEERRAIGA